MVRVGVLSLFLALAPALALAAPADDDVELTPEQLAKQNSAEYIRLSQDLEELASRNAWGGVERTYQQILATGVPPSFQDHLTAAHAARATGDVNAVRDRLVAANELKEDRSVLDWLYDIDSNYGIVSLMGDLGAVELVPSAMPFNPDHLAAVQFAVKAVSEGGAYEGYLPAGTYQFASQEVKVQPRVATVRIDLRGVSEGKKKKRPVD